MSGECDKCNEHAVDCKCNEKIRLEFALSALSIGLTHLSSLGYKIPDKLEFILTNPIPPNNPYPLPNLLPPSSSSPNPPKPPLWPFGSMCE